MSVAPILLQRIRQTLQVNDAWTNNSLNVPDPTQSAADNWETFIYQSEKKRHPISATEHRLSISIPPP